MIPLSVARAARELPNLGVSVCTRVRTTLVRPQPRLLQGDMWAKTAVAFAATNNDAERLLRRGVLGPKNAFGCPSAAGCCFAKGCYRWCKRDGRKRGRYGAIC